MERLKYIEMLDDIAFDFDLEVIETTTGANGYPEKIKRALIGFDDNEFTKAEHIAKEYGLNIEIFKRKAGNQLWYRNRSHALEPFKVKDDDYTATSEYKEIETERMDYEEDGTYYVIGLIGNY
jgi:hypothetical protein